jgi:hypothetical protein
MQDGAGQAGEAAGWHIPAPELLPDHAVEGKLAEYIPSATWQRLYPCAAPGPLHRRAPAMVSSLR